MPGSSSHGIFLSYRREDATPYARLLKSELNGRFPDAPVFMDLDSIEPGLDFVEVIERAVGSCAVMVVLIGRQWATLVDEGGQRRLDDPDDFVRSEVQTALERGVRVIPVLVDGARPVRRQELPSELQKLARLNALELSSGRYQYDADRLLDVIQRVLAPIREREEAERKARAETEEKAQAESVASPPAAAHYDLVLRKMVDEGSLVPFLGSWLAGGPVGQPDGSGSPSDAKELAADLAERFDVNSTAHLSEVAQQVYLTTGRQDFYRTLTRILMARSQPGPVHRFLARLPVMLEDRGLGKRHQLIVSTNFDTALERAFEDEGEPYDLVVYMASGPDKGKFIHCPYEGAPEPIAVPNSYVKLPIGDSYELKRTVIVKTYGTVDGKVGDYSWKENYVITDDQYIDYLSRGLIENIVPVQILDKLRDSHCLFLGYPARDWRQRDFLNRVWGGEPLGAKSWAIEPDPDALEKQYWTQSLVDLYAADLTQYVNQLTERLTARVPQ